MHDESDRNSLRGIEHVSMPDYPYVDWRGYEQALRFVQTRNPTFESIVICDRSEGRS